MTRIKLADRTLPTYTKSEEAFNSISHIVGGGLSICMLAACIVISVMHKSTIGLVCSLVYGICNILLYTMSSIYHGLPQGMAKKVFQVLDHCSVYLMIAGAYTPISLIAVYRVNPTAGIALFAFEWSITILAIVFTAIDLKSTKVFSMICDLVLGWAIICIPSIAIQALTINGFWFILSGGILYTIGAILYGIGRKKSYMHCVFHVFIIIASVLHFLGIFLYIL